VTSAPGSEPFIGEFQEARGDSVWIRWRQSQQTIGVPLSAISRLEVSREQSPRTWAGAGLGFLAGAAIGGVAGAREGAEMGDTGARVALSGITMGCLVMIFGALFGHSCTAYHWTPVWNREEAP
jgi:hypothetical protein